MIKENERGKMRHLLDKTEEDLFALLGTDLNAHSGLSTDREESVRHGKRWFELHLPSLQERVCSSELAGLFIEGGDELLLLGGVVDLIGSVCFGVTPATVATLIVKIGLKNFCATRPSVGT